MVGESIMSVGSSVQILRDIQTLFDTGAASGLSDRQLLERFSSGRDASAEAAFETIVQRHGPMVLRLCSKVLGNQADAEEAFQATFLILVKKSRSIRQLDTVGGWLFGVASRVAARAQVERARRRSAEQHGGLRIATAADVGSEGIDRIEVDAAIEAEVLRLPEKYRAVVVLCYWDGLTHEQAADRLGCPLGTVRSRMARARSLLHRRLSRRGLEPVAGIMAAAFDSPATLKVSALEIPSALISSTVSIATEVASGGSLARVASAPIATLVQKVIGSMFMMKLKTISALIVLMSAAAYGLTFAAAQGERAGRKVQDRVPATPITKSKAQPPMRLMTDYVVEPPDLLVVEVLDALPGRPISGERLVRPDGKISLSYYGDVYVAGLTLPEVKEKIVHHMRKYLHDDVLGLIKLDDEGNPIRDSKTDEYVRIDPRVTDRVFVDVTAYNSKNYYVEGAVVVPGKLPVTGTERVLDAISYAGGLLPEADHEQVFLYHQAGKGEPVKTLRIDIDQIMMGDDLSTNYQVLPGDKLVVRMRKDAAPANADGKRRPVTPNSKPEESNGYFNRLEVANASGEDAANVETKGNPEPSLRALEKRIGAMERKLDQILEAIKHPRH
jgi:RNA polymerase sigma factor (sigma-70 family)